MRTPAKIFLLRLLEIFIMGSCVSGCQNQTVLPIAQSIDPAGLPDKLEIIRQGLTSSPGPAHAIVDLDGDGVSKVCVISQPSEMNLGEPSHITIADIDMVKARFQRNFAGPIAVTFLDADSDGAREIFVSEQLGNIVVLKIFNAKGDLLKQFPVAAGGPRGERPWRCSVEPVGMMDANGDGRADLVLKVHTSYAYQPRGIWVYDYLSGALIWSHPTGAVIASTTLVDLDGDGQTEILSGTNAPNNGGGEAVNGSDDSHAYLLILNQRGQKLTMPRFGGVFSAVHAAAHDMDHDGHPEIVVLKSSRNLHPPEKSLIGFWDFANARLYRSKESERQLSDVLLFIDFEGDGVDEFLTFWVDGTLQLRNRDNEIVQTLALGETLSDKPWVSDLNADGDPEIVICGASAMYVFSKRLALLAKFPSLSPAAQEISYGAGKGKGIFLVSANRWYRLELQRNYRAAVRLAWPLVFSFLIGVGLALVIVAGVRQWRSRSLGSLADQHYLRHPDRGVVVIDANGLIRSANERAREILDLHDAVLQHAPYAEAFNNPAFAELRALLEKSLTGELALCRNRLAFHLEKQWREVLVSINPIHDEHGRQRGRLVILEDVTALAQSRRAIAWAAMAQRLAHQIKTPLSSVTLAVQRLQMEYQRDSAPKAEVYDRYVDYVTHEVRRLREVTDGFMKLARLEAPTLRAQDLNEIIRQCLEKIRPRISEPLQIDADLAADLPPVNLDENQIRVALEVLLDNSFEAMQGQGKLFITTRLAHALQFESGEDSAAHVRIEIADTGRGMPSEVCEKLFEPFFTTKKDGTGLGLTIARKIIEDHRGTIEIKSEAGMGTVVVVTLPV